MTIAVRLGQAMSSDITLLRAGGGNTIFCARNRGRDGGNRPYTRSDSLYSAPTARMP